MLFCAGGAFVFCVLVCLFVEQSIVFISRVKACVELNHVCICCGFSRVLYIRTSSKTFPELESP